MRYIFKKIYHFCYVLFHDNVCYNNMKNLRKSTVSFYYMLIVGWLAMIDSASALKYFKPSFNKNVGMRLSNVIYYEMDINTTFRLPFLFYFRTQFFLSCTHNWRYRSHPNYN